MSSKRVARAASVQGRAVGVREVRALLPWLPVTSVDAMHPTANVLQPSTQREYRELCRRARHKQLPAIATLASANDIRDPDPMLASKVDGLIAGDVFLDHYAGYGGRVVSIPLVGLLTPQCFVDMSYIAELRGRLPRADSEEQLFDYSFTVLHWD